MSGFHESLDAALGRAGERDEVEALADMLDRWERGLDGANETDHWADRLARALLASDWLAQRIEQAKAEERERIASAIEAERVVAFVVEQGSGWNHAITRAARIAREVPDA